MNQDNPVRRESNRAALLITIDGPAGAGKTTVSRLLAAKMAYRYVDTGALYRGVAVVVTNLGLNVDDDKKLEHLLRNLKLQFTSSNDGEHLIANGKDVTDQLRYPEISMHASALSAKPVVRKYLLEIQREMGAGKSVVFEGRDMGTVVFPKADIKFYLDATAKIRALRRYNQRGASAEQSLAEVAADMKFRDEKDRKRALAPLKAAPDAIIIDTSNLSIEEVVDQMVLHIQQLGL